MKFPAEARIILTRENDTPESMTYGEFCALADIDAEWKAEDRDEWQAEMDRIISELGQINGGAVDGPGWHIILDAPTAIRPGFAPIEWALYYIALKDRSERRIQSERRPSIWGGMQDYSGGYQGKSLEAMVSEAMLQMVRDAAPAGWAVAETSVQG